MTVYFLHHQPRKIYIPFGVKKIIDSVLNGYNGAVLAYGQTSSGKIYTMQGEMEEECTQGIKPRMITHVFKYIYNTEGIDFTTKVSMIEIYSGENKRFIRYITC